MSPIFTEFPTRIIEIPIGRIFFNDGDIESSHRELLVKRVKSTEHLKMTDEDLLREKISRERHALRPNARLGGNSAGSPLMPRTFFMLKQGLLNELELPSITCCSLH